jgi:hypothetical protein
VIKNPKYRTPEGVYTGMPLKQLKARAKLKSVDFNYDDGLILISETFDGGFLIDISSLKDSKYDFAKPKISTLPSDLKIKEIILF